MLLQPLPAAEHPAAQVARRLAFVHAHVAEEGGLRVERLLAQKTDPVEGLRARASAGPAAARSDTCRRREGQIRREHVLTGVDTAGRGLKGTSF